MNDTRMYTEAETLKHMSRAVRWYELGRRRGYIVGACMAIGVAAIYTQIRSIKAEKEAKVKVKENKDA